MRFWESNCITQEQLGPNMTQLRVDFSRKRKRERWHSYLDTQNFWHSHTHTHAHMHTQAHTQTRSHMHTHAHTHMQAHTQNRAHLYTRVHICTRRHIRRLVHIYTHARTYAHAHASCRLDKPNHGCISSSSLARHRGGERQRRRGFAPWRRRWRVYLRGD